jgi:hypothetical protein
MKTPRRVLTIGRLAVLLLTAVIIAAYAGDDPQDQTRLPGVSGADNELQRGAANIIWMLEGIEIARQGTEVAACELGERRIVDTEVLKLPKRPGKSPWVEKWTVDRCGELVYYSIEFTPTPKKGGADIEVTPMDEN